MLEWPAIIKCLFFFACREQNSKKMNKSVLELGNMPKMLDKLALWCLLALAPKYRPQLKNGKDHKANVQCSPDAGKEQTWWHVLWLLIKQDAVSLGAVILGKIWIHLNVKQSFIAPMGLSLVEQARANWPVGSGWGFTCHQGAVLIWFRLHAY